MIELCMFHWRVPAHEILDNWSEEMLALMLQAAEHRIEEQTKQSEQKPGTQTMLRLN